MRKTRNKKAKLSWLPIIGLLLLLMGNKAANLATLSDPTQPPPEFMPTNSSPVTWQNMTLGAVFINSDSRTAIINSKAYHEGDKLGEYTITKINVNTVELIGSDQAKEVLQLVSAVKTAVPTKENSDKEI